jgi:hypothetical protein
MEYRWEAFAREHRRKRGETIANYLKRYDNWLTPQIEAERDKHWRDGWKRRSKAVLANCR